MKKTKLILIFSAFLVMAVIATGYLTDQQLWRGLRRTGPHNDSDAVLLVDTYQKVNKYPVYEVPSLSYLSGDSIIYDFEEFKGVLYAVGNFLYKFDGENWQTVSTYYGGFALKTYGNKLYIAADRGRLFSYDGTSFTTKHLETQYLYDLEIFKNMLFIAGYSDDKDGVIYSYDGTTYSKLNRNATTSLAVVGSILYGSTRNGSLLNSTDGITFYTEYTFSPTDVHPLEVYNGKLYLVSDQRLYNWDGATMLLNLSVGNASSMVEYNDRLYITAVDGKLYVYDDYDDSVSSEIMSSSLYGIGLFNGKLYLGSGDNGSIYAYQKETVREVVIKSTLTDPLLVNATITNVPLPINISNYGMKEWTTTIIGNNTNVSDVVFNSLLEHLIIQPNSSTVNWRFKLTDSEGYIIYDGTQIDQTGRMGLIVDLPLIGVINTTIQNVTETTKFDVKIVYT